MSPSAARPAVFLDRDGTLIHDRHYLADPAGVELLPGAAEAVARFNRAGLFVALITNQSGIGRGYYTEADMHALHAKMDAALAGVGGHIDAFYYAPHHPEAALDAYRHPDPPDRKPNPGMILKALSEWRINREASILVGDKPSDMEAATRAGVRGVLFPGGNLKTFLEAEALLA